MADREIKVVGNCITMPCGKSMVFPYEIGKYVVYMDLVFVILNYPIKEVQNENVFALDEQGEVVWQIQEVATLEKQYCPYVDIAVDKESGNLLLWSWCCWRYWVAPKTGKILKAEFTK